MLDAVKQVVNDGRSIHRVALNLDMSHHALARYVKMYLNGQGIYELNTNKNEENERIDY